MVRRYHLRLSAGLLAGGIGLSLVAGYLLDRLEQQRRSQAFRVQAGQVLDRIAQRLTEYETMVALALSLYQDGTMVTKDQDRSYLWRIPRQAGPLRIESPSRDTPPADPVQDFAEEWATLLPPVDTRPATLVWHLPIYRPGAPFASPAERREACAGAIEAWFDLDELFAELVQQSQDLGLRVAVAPPLVSGEIRTMKPIVFMDRFQAAAQLGAEGREFDFVTTSLRVDLSAAPTVGLSRWLGIVVASFGVLGSLWLSRVVRNRYERRLLESERALDRFAQVMATAELGAAVTHELTQPLTGVLGCLEGVLTRAERGNLTVELARRDLSQALRFAQRACEFIEDVRRQTGQGRANHSTRPVAVAEVLRQVVAMARLYRRFQPIRIHLQLPDPRQRVLATEIALECVLLNLLRNSAEAILGAGRGGTIWLDAARDGDQVSLRVSDDGPGLSQPDKLFQPFQTTKPQGMGLGLCYCKRTVEGFGGTIQGGNRPEGGTCFVIRLPLGEQ